VTNGPSGLDCIPFTTLRVRLLLNANRVFARQNQVRHKAFNEKLW
jgi:hypothetical protein